MKIAAGLILTVALLLSCDDPIQPRVHHTSCDDASGVTHSGTGGNARWKAADGPHRLSGTVTLDRLEIEAGALVCGAAGATLRVSHLMAVGTPGAPIVFAAEDASQPWGGLLVSVGGPAYETSRMEHVVVRDLAGGVEANRLEIRNGRVERACQTTAPCAAVWGTGYGSLTLEDVVVDSSGGRGVSSGWRASMSLTRVRIQNSAGIGLSLYDGDSGNGVALVAEGLRIVGGATYPARIGSWLLEQLAGSREAVDSLIGNASDTLLIAVVGDAIEAPMTVYRDLPWRLIRNALSGSPPKLTIPDLTLEAGSSVSFDHHETVLRVRRLKAVGTPQEPVVIEGGTLTWGTPGGDPAVDTARFADARLVRMNLNSFWSGGAVTLDVDGLEATRTTIRIETGTRAEIRNATFDSSNIVVGSAEAVFEEVDFLRSGWYSPYDAPSPAIQVDAGTVTVTDCEIREGTSDALHVGEAAAEGTSITGCNLAENAGFGVNNLSPFTVDASGNWWGDPAGPDGPEGDGLAGPGVVEPVRTEPVPH